MRTRAATTMLIVLALAGCGSSGAAKQASSATHASSTAAATSTTAATSPAASTGSAAVSAFTTHAGLAFGTFYRFIYAPYRTGSFRALAADRAALSRAALAATYVAAQVEQATAAARSSAALAKLVAPLRVLEEGFRSALVKLRTGHFKMSEIEAANLAISAIKGSATSAGIPITEATPSAI